MKAELKRAFDYLGLDFRAIGNNYNHELHFGLKVDEQVKVNAIHPGSPALLSKLSQGDKILSINGISINNKSDFENWLSFFGEEKIELQIERSNLLRTTEIKKSRKNFYQNYEVFKINSPSKAQVKAFEKWSHRKFARE
jgi:predicted metalloprotease with PDZ domain